MPKIGKRLTDAVVKQAPHRPERYDIADGGSGLILRIEARPSKQKTWQARYRTPNGQQRRISVGGYPELSLLQARAKVAEIKDAVARGEDPASGRNPGGRDAITVGAFIGVFIERHFPNLLPKTAADYHRYLDRDVRRVWGKRPLKSIGRADAADLVDTVAQRAQKAGGTGAAGSMIRRVLSKMFDCAVAWGYLDANPVVGTKAPTRTVRRSTRLAVEETDGGKDVEGQIGDFVAQLDTPKTRAETRTAILLCLLLGLRVKEATSLQVRYIDLKSGRVFIQGKGAKERALPLVGLAARLVEEQIAASGDLKTPWLFPQRHNPDQHITESSVTHAVGRAASAAGMDQLTTHDLRRTCATGMRALGTDRDVVSRILGHSQHDVTATYVQAELWPEKQQALERWGEHVKSHLSST